MSAAYKRTFRVRRYECDPYGHVNNTNYLRYMLETALDADGAVGIDAATCAAENVRWATRAVDVEYLRPLRYGDSVEVHSWVGGCDGQTVRRCFDLHRPGDEGPVARGYVDVGLVGWDNGDSVQLPAQWTAALCPADMTTLPEAEPFPVAPPPPPGVFKMRRRVAWHEMESPNYAHDAACLVWIEDCGMGVIAAHGWPALRMAADGFAILIRRNQVEYLAPARLNDELEIATWASHIKRISAIRHYTITRASDGALLARVHSLGVWVDLNTGRPIRIPPGFMDDFAPNLVW